MLVLMMNDFMSRLAIYWKGIEKEYHYSDQVLQPLTSCCVLSLSSDPSLQSLIIALAVN